MANRLGKLYVTHSVRFTDRGRQVRPAEGPIASGLGKLYATHFVQFADRGRQVRPAEGQMATGFGKLYPTHFVQFADRGRQVRLLDRYDKPWWFRNYYEVYSLRIGTARRLHTNSGLASTLPRLLYFATTKFGK